MPSLHHAIVQNDCQELSDELMERIRKMMHFSDKITDRFCRRRAWPGFFPTLLILLALGLVGCTRVRTFTTQSRPADREVIIDGRPDEWAGSMFFIEDEGISLGFLNDKNSFYICLRTEERPVQSQIMMAGLTVWFDPKGGKEKALGIKFPVGMSPDERLRPQGDIEEEEDEPRPRRPGGERLRELEIIRSGKDEPERLEVDEVKGIEVKILPSRAGLVYELKIPLVATAESPVAVGAEPGKTIGIGFETGKLEFGGTYRGRGGIPGGGMPPMGGLIGRGGMARMRVGRDFEMPKEIKIWATVRLSSGENPEPPDVQGLTFSSQLLP